MADLESAAGSSARPISDIDVDLEAEGLFDWDFEATPSEEIKGMRALIPLILVRVYLLARSPITCSAFPSLRSFHKNVTTG